MNDQEMVRVQFTDPRGKIHILRLNGTKLTDVALGSLFNRVMTSIQSAGWRIENLMDLKDLRTAADITEAISRGELGGITEDVIIPFLPEQQRKHEPLDMAAWGSIAPMLREVFNGSV